MAKQNLAATTANKDAQAKLLDLADHQLDQPREKRPQEPMRRSTERLTISLLEEEKRAIEDRAHRFRMSGHRELKASRLARIAFQMLLEATDEEILKTADDVENLEIRRGNRYDEDRKIG